MDFNHLLKHFCPHQKNTMTRAEFLPSSPPRLSRFSRAASGYGTFSMLEKQMPLFTWHVAWWHGEPHQDSPGIHQRWPGKMVGKLLNIHDSSSLTIIVDNCHLWFTILYRTVSRNMRLNLHQPQLSVTKTGPMIKEQKGSWREGMIPWPWDEPSLVETGFVYMFWRADSLNCYGIPFIQRTLK